MQLELSPQEQELLRELTASAMGELRVEVRRTKTPDYHDQLKAKEEVLAGIIARLGDAS